MFGMGNTFDRNAGFSTCWSNLPFGFKFFFTCSLVLAILQLFMKGVTYYFYSYPLGTIYLYEFYRPFTSLYLAVGVNGLINMLVNFLWFLDIWPNMEKKCSTLFILINIIIHNLLVQLTFTLIIGIYSIFNDLSQIWGFFSGGWGSILIIYMFKESTNNPNQNLRFCFFPCLIQKRYFPWIIVVFQILFQTGPGDLIVCLIATLIGCIEAFYLKTNIIRFPFGLYSRIQYCMPRSLKDRGDYMEVGDVKQNLLPFTCSCYKTDESVEVYGNGVVVGANDIANRVGNNVGVAVGSNFAQNPINIREINIRRFEAIDKQAQIEKANAEEQLYNEKVNVEQQLYDEDLYEDGQNHKYEGISDSTIISQKALINKKQLNEQQ